MGETREHLTALASLGLRGSSAQRLAAYLDLVAAWNQRVNLTGACTPEERCQRLVAPALRAREAVVGPSLLDVGSGNGSPGLVLAVLRPELAVTLLEPRTRRWAFLREAARALGVPAEALRSRHDAYAGPPASTVTVRALALPAAALVGLIAPGGRLLLFRSEAAVPEGFRRIPWPDAGLTVLGRECFT